MEDKNLKMAETQYSCALSGRGAVLTRSDAGFGGLKAENRCCDWFLRKFISLEVWKFGRNKVSQLWQDFTCPNFIFLQASKLPSCQTSLVPYCPSALVPSKAFTMAEILISLTIIGVIAAITLPALQANINESAWSAQRKALYSRMSQALGMLPSLNGYGIGASNQETADKATETFINQGLGNILNITNICSNDNFKMCGLPSKITVLGTNSKMIFPTNLSELNSKITASTQYFSQIIDTKAVAFETKNGDSIAVFYNPFCSSYNEVNDFVQRHVCLNFIYDLNGRRGPNKVNKDVGFITAIFADDFHIVMPIPLEKNAANSRYILHSDALASCRAQDKNSRLPNRFELGAMFYNQQLIGIESQSFWSSSILSSDNGSKFWFLNFNGGYSATVSDNTYRVRCIKR